MEDSISTFYIFNVLCLYPIVIYILPVIMITFKFHITAIMIIVMCIMWYFNLTIISHHFSSNKKNLRHYINTGDNNKNHYLKLKAMEMKHNKDVMINNNKRLAVIQYDPKIKSLNFIPVRYEVVRQYKDRPREISECREWLHFIVANYNNLPEYTIFLHGDSVSWHTSPAYYFKFDGIFQYLHHHIVYNYFRIRQFYFDKIANVESPYVEVFDEEYSKLISASQPEYIKMLVS